MQLSYWEKNEKGLVCKVIYIKIFEVLQRASFDEIAGY
jgi:hypothetical protein